jgi:DNA modification methylase
MAKIEITKTELVWPGKYNEDGTRREIQQVNLPFQVIETVNESRATREAKNAPQAALFDIYRGTEGETFEKGWKNKLIWGDNALVMSSLLDKFAGKIDLIYIDPPFATGADFSFTAEIGDSGEQIAKDQSAIEEKAYRDTWGRGLDSYLSMLRDRLVLIRELLSETGSLYVHIGPYIVSYVKCICDEVFGIDNAVSEIVWKRQVAHSDSNSYANLHDNILFYRRGVSTTFNTQYVPYTQKHIDENYRYNDERGVFALGQLKAPGNRGPRYTWNGIDRHWRYTEANMTKLNEEGRIYHSERGIPWKKLYLKEMPGVAVGSVWSDINPIHAMDTKERLNYATQKPQALLDRIIKTSSSSGDLVADFFCGSGTTLAVAEKLQRRWLGCDLGRYAIHTARKRLLDIENSKAFEILNLGKYERQYWQGVTFAEKGNTLTEKALYEYLAFILKLYGAQPVAGLVNLHGKRGRALVHIGAVDAPVTIDEVNAALSECVQLKQAELHILGWEWEMGINNLLPPEAKKQGVKLLFLQIPREVMEQQAVDKGDIEFFELAYLEVDIQKPKKLSTQIKLKGFVIPNTELIPEEVRSKVKKWSDYIDYWAIDWDFQNDTFMQGWVNYRTRKDRSLALVSDPHTYEKAGRYRVLVKVVDIFGNDTTQAFDVDVK